MARGQLYRLARKSDLAILDFNAALEIDPQHVDAFLSAAVL